MPAEVQAVRRRPVSIVEDRFGGLESTRRKVVISRGE
jgi:hypothetical protein